ncbi:MAG: hypothetical protein WCK05_12435 [Planctomycetota bacterium]
MLNIPDWVSKIMKEITCPHCGRKLKVDNVTAIGVREARGDPVDGKSSAVFAENACYGCGRSFSYILAHHTLREFAADVMKHHVMGGHATSSEPPVGELPECQETRESAAAPAAAEGYRVTPSIRPGTPAAAINDDEVKRAARTLGRIVFRPGAATWKRFLKRLGA